MSDFWIAPSILAADFARLGDEVDAVVAAGADLIHFDVMDNHYVPNLSIGPLVLTSLHKHGVKIPVDVHLMVKPVDRLIGDFLDAGANYISIHPEATEHIHRSPLTRPWAMASNSSSRSENGPAGAPSKRAGLTSDMPQYVYGRSAFRVTRCPSNPKSPSLRCGGVVVRTRCARASSSGRSSRANG